MGPDKKVFKALAMVTQFGINVIVPVFICLFIGIGLDDLLGTSFLAILMFFIGAAAGFRNIYIMSKDIYGDEGQKKRKH